MFVGRQKWIRMLVTILLLGVIAFSAFFINPAVYTGGFFSTILYPFQKAFYSVDQSFRQVSIYFENKQQLALENEILRKRIEEIEKDNRALKEYRNKINELKSALGIKERFFDFNIKGANIIGKDLGNWFQRFTIDIGKRDGVYQNVPVITGNGLVGRVEKSDLISARVISILDPDSTVSARLTKTRDLVLVKGDIVLKERGLCRLEYIPGDVSLVEGDMIETSGLGGIFPRGILVGRVTQVYFMESNYMKYAEIEPVADFKKLEEVFVLTPKG